MPRFVRLCPPRFLLNTFVLLAVAWPTAVYAGTILDPASGFLAVGEGTVPPYVNPVTGLYPAGFTSSYSSSGATGSMNGSNSYGPDPQTSASLNIFGTLTAGQVFIAASDVAYKFEVIGPANQTVTVNLAGAGQNSISNDGTGAVEFLGQSLFLIQPDSLPATPANLLLDAVACSGNFNSTYCSATGSSSGTFNVNMSLQVTTDVLYDVAIDSEIRVDSISGDSTPTLYTGQSSVDPTITLATTNPAYSLQFSPAPTPEPNYLALTSPCLAIGWLLAQRRRRSLLADCL
jgi:hypothetical protein